MAIIKQTYSQDDANGINEMNETCKTNHWDFSPANDVQLINLKKKSCDSLNL